MPLLDGIAAFITDFERGVRIYVSDLLARTRSFTTRVYRTLLRYLRRAEDYLVDRIVDLLGIAWNLSKILTFYIVGMAPFIAAAVFRRNAYWLLGALFWALLLTAKGFSHLRNQKGTERDMVTASDADENKEINSLEIVVRLAVRLLAILGIVALSIVTYLLYEEYEELQSRREREERAEIKKHEQVRSESAQAKKDALQRIEEERKRVELEQARNLVEQSLEQLAPILVAVSRHFVDTGRIPLWDEWVTKHGYDHSEDRLFVIREMLRGRRLLLEYETENGLLVNKYLLIQPFGSFASYSFSFKWTCFVLSNWQKPEQWGLPKGFTFESQIDAETLPAYYSKSFDFATSSGDRSLTLECRRKSL